VSGLVLIAPHVVVEEITVAAIHETRDRFENGDLHERLSRHHDDPDLTFRNWCDVWLDPAFRDWSLEPDAELIECPVLLIQGADDPYGTLDQLERIAARVRGPVHRVLLSGGHRVHRDAPERLLREVTIFVGEVGGRSGTAAPLGDGLTGSLTKLFD